MPRLTPEQLRADREALGLTPQQLATELLLDVSLINDWEEGRIRPTRSIEKTLQWRAAVARHEQAMAASGLPACERLQSLSDEFEAKPEDLTRFMQRVNDHVVSCDVCKARDEYATKHLPPLPRAPMPGWMYILGSFHNLVQKLPAPARPAAYGAALVGAMTAIRALFVLLTQGVSWTLLGSVFGAVAVGAYGGAVGGVAYQFAKPRVERFGQHKEYVLGVICVGAYLIAFGIPALFIVRPDWTEIMPLILFALPMTVLFGTIVGRAFFMPEERKGSDVRFFAKWMGIVAGLVVIIIGSLALISSDESADVQPLSLADAQASADANPSDPHRRLHFGLLLVDSGHFSKAVPELQAVLQKLPRSDVAYGALAAAHHEMHEYDASIHAATRAIEINPDDARYHIVLGNSFLGRSKYTDAIESYRKATLLDSTHAYAWMNRARLAHMLKRYDESAAAYERLNQLAPQFMRESEQDRNAWDEAKKQHKPE